MNQKDRINMVKERADQAIAKLRTIRKLATLNGPIASYHYEELREIIDSLRHHADAINQGKPLTEIL